MARLGWGCHGHSSLAGAVSLNRAGAGRALLELRWQGRLRTISGLKRNSQH